MSESKRTDRVLWFVFGAAVILAAVTLIALKLLPTDIPAGAGKVYPRMAAPPPSMGLGPLLRSMGIGSLTWYAVILSAPLFVILSRRFPFDRRRWLSSLALNFAIVMLLVMVTAVLQHSFTYAGAPIAPELGVYLRAALLTTTVPFFAVAAAAHAIEARSSERTRELEALRMKSQLAEARLAALTAQLQPHFLFNTLQGISSLLQHDPAEADRMLTSLSDLLREVLRRGERREVPLGEELSVLEPYLDISQRRYGRRLSIDIAVDDAARDALVPFFILQPLVENALTHGVGTHAGACHVQVRAAVTDHALVLSVQNDGTGSGNVSNGHGIGLANARARLQELYGEACTLEAGPRADGVFEVRLTIPYRTA